MYSQEEEIFYIDDENILNSSPEILLITETNNTEKTIDNSTINVASNTSDSNKKPSISPKNNTNIILNDFNLNSKISFSNQIMNNAPKRASTNTQKLDTKKQKLSSTISIKIKIDSRVISFNQLIDENFVKLYSYLFGDNKESKLLYKTVPISKYSTLKSIKIEENVFFTIQGEHIVKYDPPVIKVNYDVDKTITIQNEGITKVNELISQVIKITDVLFLKAISNGKLLKNEEIIEGDAVIDLI